MAAAGYRAVAALGAPNEGTARKTRANGDPQTPLARDVHVGREATVRRPGGRRYRPPSADRRK